MRKVTILKGFETEITIMVYSIIFLEISMVTLTQCGCFYKLSMVTLTQMWMVWF